MREYIDRYVEALSSTNLWVRLCAFSALGDMGGHAAPVVPSLARLLGDETAEIRQSAAAALGRLESTAEPALPALVEALKDEHIPVRITAGCALATIGSPAAVDPLCRLLDGETLETRLCAAWAIGKLGSLAGNAVTPLIRALRDPESAVRAMAAWALGKLGGFAGEAVPMLVAMVTSEKDTVSRKSVAVALGRIGAESHGLRPEIEWALNRAIEDPDLHVQRVAVRALRQLHLTPPEC